MFYSLILTAIISLAICGWSAPARAGDMTAAHAEASSAAISAAAEDSTSVLEPPPVSGASAAKIATPVSNTASVGTPSATISITEPAPEPVTELGAQPVTEFAKGLTASSKATAQSTASAAYSSRVSSPPAGTSVFKMSTSLKASTSARRLPRGYIADVERERTDDTRDLVWIQKPYDGGNLHDKIFNETLSREFRERYEQRFGQTEIERVFLAPNRTSYYNDAYGQKGTPQEMLDERRKFGEFMVRRLAEWHVENYAKTDPQVRVVWEAKEKISNYKLEVASFRVDAQYSIAGNILDIKMVNPYVQSKLSLLMNPDQFGPGPIDEALLSLFKQINSRYAAEARWRVTDGVVSLIHYKPIARHWSGSLTTSAAVHGAGRSARETLWLVGIGRAF